MFVEVKDIAGLLLPGQTLLGLDLGSKTIGMAISDPAMRIASPIGTVKRTKFTKDMAELAKKIELHNVGGLIFGMPLNMDGTQGPRAQSTRQFAWNLKHNGMDLPIALWDERLSTAAVERVLIEQADMNRKRRSEVVDKAAASYILQGALDFIIETM
ncbi:Holliday junction resolvase RuvX [Curvivirga aplysinae]|uniref:Holliday junction resolvase RuvX n=1 Tax=Curvivirga aplysinae TaxID=2529852 RepID=UPI0012BC2152|nr:Holliday junction resolvase RuvX [Curvivirga aplysinae]MTI10310.1 Holliday junction resolvase RuvX [Curvivirga aplysinae]